jgi:hypothetical protein
MKFMYDSERQDGQKITFINKAGQVIEKSFVSLSVKIDEKGNNDIVELICPINGIYVPFTWDMGKQ